MRNLGFANLLRFWMNRNWKNPDDVAREWGLQRETVVKLLSGELIPSDGQIPAISRKMGYGQTAIRDAIRGKAKADATVEDILKMFNFNK